MLSHIIIGLALIVLPIVILLYLKDRSLSKMLAVVTMALSWILLYPAGKLYMTFYPATKNVIKAGGWPWAHDILMETKEHWGILIPIIATVAAGLVLTGKSKESKKWWVLLLVVAALLGIFGRIIKIGALR